MVTSEWPRCIHGTSADTMKHAGEKALATIVTQLAQIRVLNLKERSPGVFYFKSKPFPHFHEDPSGIYADVRVEIEWERFAVADPSEWRKLLKRINDAL
jgi:hypothetical protein